MTFLPYLVIASYASIHLLEYLSYYARVAGRVAGKPVTGYAIQNATTTVTRFFYLALMPLLGFMVDRQVPISLYIKMGLGALICAALLSLAARAMRHVWIRMLANFVLRRAGQPTMSAAEIRAQLEAPTRLQLRKIVVLAAAVFLCYSLGVLLSYFFALVFHDYRSTISQLSGIINGAATVLLTFVLEPRVARIVDDHATADVYQAIQAMLAGRLIAVGLIAPVLFLGISNAFA
ncbi:lipid II flippase family protein [Achromobacter xylosoxidans]